MQVVRLLMTWILGIVLTLVVWSWDVKRLDDEQRARSWNYATLAQAIFNFGPLAMLGWGWVTRRGKGLVLGGIAAGVLTVVVALIVAAFVDGLLITLFGFKDRVTP